MMLTRLASSRAGDSKHFKLLITGGGTGGCTTAHKFVNKLGKGQLGLIEPAEMHYYQPMWTLVGSGIKKLEQSGMKMSSVLPKEAVWIKDRVAEFDPDHNLVRTAGGSTYTYDYLVVALGIQLRYDWVKGLPEAIKQDPRVCSNYSVDTVLKTLKAFEAFKGGRAVFTFPNTPIKCAGAPQKIMYLFDDFLRKRNSRSTANIEYHTSLPVIFGIKKYADRLNAICQRRDLQVKLRENLVEVNSAKSEAIFENLDTKKRSIVNYDLLHATPPMGPVAPLELLKSASSPFVDAGGFVAVDKETLRHTRYPNVFALGDCSSLPTSKTAAAISGQGSILTRNLTDVMAGGQGDKAKYDGYTSCPLVTTSNTCILAEFDYNGQPLETMPIDQGVERWSSFILKAHLMPQLYWHGLIKGMWNGPGVIRKILHLGRSR